MHVRASLETRCGAIAPCDAVIQCGSSRLGARRREFLGQSFLKGGVQQVSWRQGRGERCGGEESVELVLVPACVARGEDDLDEDLFIRADPRVNLIAVIRSFG